MIPVQSILELLNPISFFGDKLQHVDKVVQLTPGNTVPNVLMWCSAKNKDQLNQIECGTIICSEILEEVRKPNCNYIIVEHPRQAFQKVVSSFFTKPVKRGVAASAVIHSSVEIGADAYIGEYVVIEADCIIGDNVFIDHHTVIKENTLIGNNVKIGSNNVIGGVGFGYEKNESGEYDLIPHLGNIIIEDYVEIGNCTCIDRAVLGSTTLRKNVKVDNLVHIAHGVEIGENSLIIANAMIAGSVKIGQNAWIAPSSSILNQITIHDNALIGMGAVVIKNVDSHQVVVGNPARSIQK